MNASVFEVPYADLAGQAGEIKKALLDAVEGVLDSGRYILGPEVAAFEREFAAQYGAGHAVGVGNGTCALIHTLRALGLPAGSEVITAPNSFVASAAAISLAGLTIRFADIGADLNIDPEAVRASITPKTRALLPVHLTGRPARMRELRAIADEHGLAVIEDAAQAVGARLDGVSVGALGDAACFSLHPLKNLHAYGDAGVVTTSDVALRDALFVSRNHGLADRDTCIAWGWNSRLDELHAAMLRVQLGVIDRWTAERRRLAHRYNDALRGLVVVPDEAPGEWCVFQTYVVQVDDRDALQAFLRARGIEALVHYPRPIHLQPAAAELGYRGADLPNATAASHRILSLPLHPRLPEDRQDHVIDAIREFYRA